MRKTAYILLCLTVIVSLYFFTIGRGAYKLSEGIGYSTTIEESKKRGVFIKELDYKIIPDTIEINKGIKFFIERGFRYGKYSAAKTLPLKDTDDYIYRIIIEKDTLKLFKGPYSTDGKGDSYRFDVIKDTFRSNIVIRSSPYDSIYKVGELLLFDKKS